MVCETNRLIRSCRQQRGRRRNRRKMNNNKERRKRYKRKQRKSKEFRINEAWKEILTRSEEIVRDEPQEHAPLDKTGVQWDQSKLNLIRKGQKFVPAPRRVDTVAKFDHFENFARKLRLKVFFSNRKNGNDGNESEQADEERMPWESMSTFCPMSGENETLEKFLTELSKYLFDPNNRNEFKDNLSRAERGALRDLRTWNKDPENPRVIRVQDKGSRFVVDWKSNYESKVLEYLQDVSTFRQSDENPNELISEKVDNFIERWQGDDGLSEEECNWIKVHNPKPATIYANIKTHKEDWPYRFIMSAKGTATEFLAKWIECKLKPYARLHKSYIRDTKAFLQYLEIVNETRAPLGINTTLNSWDIVNFYPNCNTQMCINAVKKVVEDNPQVDLGVPVDCVLEALELTMSSNNGEFRNNFFTQINGATIGGPESASVTDIFGAVYVDPVAERSGPFAPTEWKRYRDDTWDLEEEVTEPQLHEFTEYMNSSVLQNKIKFTMETSKQDLVFLDTKVHLREGYLIPEIYSKPTDSHEYLHPKSCHPPQVAKNNPYSVALRVRRNCSDRVPDDKMFTENLVKYKAYLLESGYASDGIDKHFIKVAKLKRKDVLDGKVKCMNRKLGAKKINFVTTWDPMFPNISQAIKKFQHILEEDDLCKQIFPKGTFRVAYKRGHNNLKELIAPSKISFRDSKEGIRGKRQYIGKCRKCGECGKSIRGRKRASGIYCCQVLEENDQFLSRTTGERYKIRQDISCKSENIIYLVNCKNCRMQGVGSCKDFAKRVSNYISSIERKSPGCKIEQHFLQWGHSIQDFAVLGIVKLENPPPDPIERLREFEGYWMVKLNMLEPHGMNSINEYERIVKKSGLRVMFDDNLLGAS